MKEAKDIWGRPMTIATADEQARFPKIEWHGRLSPTQLAQQTMVTRSGGLLRESWNRIPPRERQARNRQRKRA